MARKSGELEWQDECKGGKCIDKVDMSRKSMLLRVRVNGCRVDGERVRCWNHATQSSVGYERMNRESRD